MQTNENKIQIDYSEIIVSILKQIYAEKIILFDSRPRCDNKTESDLELLIIH